MNAGAYGMEISDIIDSIVLLLIHDGEAVCRTVDNVYAEFGYRESRFRHGTYVILGIDIDLDVVEKRIESGSRLNDWESVRRKDQRYNFKSVGSILKTKNIYRELCGLRGYIIKGLDSLLWRMVPDELEREQKIRAKILTFLAIVLFLDCDFSGYCDFNVNIIKRGARKLSSDKEEFEKFKQQIERLEGACCRPLGREVIVWEEDSELRCR